MMNRINFKDMTKQEFEHRTLVNVSFDEYEHIEAIYMASDLDKDEFCRMWCKMNKSRVNKAKEEAKEAKRIESLTLVDYAIEIVNKMALEQSEKSGSRYPVSDVELDAKRIRNTINGKSDFVIWLLLRPTGSTLTANEIEARKDFNEFSKGNLYKLHCVDLTGKGIYITEIATK